ncbi:hypothetical protein FQN54_004098 [Arachnomyces sp. PD_36]|nr:hypothetical protein FQN54_004098 [Arachnomyces sp. PD_36]
MSLFPRFSSHPYHSHTHTHPSSELNPLLRLLNDYDFPTLSTATPNLPSFSPKFDVRETGDAYHLDGELPGIAQNEINIEFTDPQTMVVKGRVEREYSEGDKPETKKARVEDESEEQEAGAGEKGKEVSRGGEKRVMKAEEGERHSYWVSERSVGEFHRTFSFPSRVDSEGVKAKLKNGILSVTVPKVRAEKAGKKITIE